jgi:hypothetical protein
LLSVVVKGHVVSERWRVVEYVVVSRRMVVGMSYVVVMGVLLEFEIVIPGV